jgi:hypothetical protein
MTERGQRGAIADQRAGDAVTFRIRDGLTYRQIGEKLGISAQAAHVAHRKGCAMHLPKEEVFEARRAALEKYDRWEQECLAVLARNHPLVNFGKVVAGVNDDGPKLQAIDRLVKIERRRAEILGYDSPKRRQLTVISEDVVDAEIRRLEEELGKTPSMDEAG